MLETRKENISGLLNHEEVKSLNLIEDAIEGNYGEASYTVRVGVLIDRLGNEVTKFPYKLQPQGMISTVTAEQFDLRNQCVYGYTTVRNTLSRIGIMGLNIGLIDPGYSGPIGVILVNFGKKPFLIKKNDQIMRVTFHQYNAPTTSIPHILESKTREDYISSKQSEAGRLPELFLNLNKTLKDFDKRVTVGIYQTLKQFSLFAIIITIAVFTVGYCYTFIRDIYIGEQNRDMIRRATAIEAQNKRLLETMRKYEKVLISSKNDSAKIKR